MTTILPVQPLTEATRYIWDPDYGKTLVGDFPPYSPPFQLLIPAVTGPYRIMRLVTDGAPAGEATRSVELDGIDYPTVLSALEALDLWLDAERDWLGEHPHEATLTLRFQVIAVHQRIEYALTRRAYYVSDRRRT